jgi:hypothetical protein
MEIYAAARTELDKRFRAAVISLVVFTIDFSRKSVRTKIVSGSENT